VGCTTEGGDHGFAIDNGYKDHFVRTASSDKGDEEKDGNNGLLHCERVLGKENL